MTTALLSTSIAMALMAVAASYILPAGTQPDHSEPYRFASAR